MRSVKSCSASSTSSWVTGIAHVSCLAEQAKILVAEAVENNLGAKAFDERWARWYECSLCEQRYHSVVSCALGWACWKTYVGRPEIDPFNLRMNAMQRLECGLSAAGKHGERVGILEAKLAIEVRLGTLEEAVLNTKNNMAHCYDQLGRTQEALELRREIYASSADVIDATHRFVFAMNLAISYIETGRVRDAKSFLRKQLPEALRALGSEDRIYIKFRWTYAQALFLNDRASRDDVVESIAIHEELAATARRVLGPAYPLTTSIQDTFAQARERLASFDK